MKLSEKRITKTWKLSQIKKDKEIEYVFLMFEVKNN